MRSGRGVLVAALAAAVLAAFVGAEGLTPAAPSASAAAAPGLTELPELRSRSSRTYRRADGVEVMRSWAASVNFKDDSGKWRAIDNTLTAGSDGLARNRANRYSLELPPTLADPVRVQRGDDWLAFNLEGARGTRQLSGNRASFEDALAGVDVRYAADADQVKEELVLDSPASPAAFAFGLNLSAGLVPELTRDGGIDLVSAQGAKPMRIAPPLMWDADGDTSRDLAYTLRREGAGWAVDLRVEREWLAAKDRAWPVTVDPTVWLSGQQDTYLASGVWANSQMGPDTVISAGLGGGGYISRGLIKFDTSSVPKNALVLEAHLGMKTAATGDSPQITVHKVNQAWTAGASWNKYSSTQSWATAGGDFDSTALDSETINGSSTGWYSWYVGRQVQEWARDPSSNHGLLVKSSNEAAQAAVHFRSSTATADQPYLEVDYQRRTGLSGDYTFDSYRLSDRMELKVNVANGNVILKQDDVKIAGAGIRLSVARYWNSQSPWDWSGQKWTFDGGSDIR